MKALKILGTPLELRILPVGNFEILEGAARLVGFPRPLRRIDSIAEAGDQTTGTAILHVELDATVPKGRVSAAAGKHAYQIMRICSEICLRRKGFGLVTCPINKESLQKAGFEGKGHTELLAEFAGVSRVETVFCIRDLKIFFLSRHVSLRDAIERVRKAEILQAILRMDRSMRELGVERPRLAVAGLNPHSGDGGLFGREEIEEILPAVSEARELGMDVQGPIGADAVFHLGLQGRFDAILALYHDQGHIAAKTHDFFQTVTLSLGLPFLRTSVDHGTGFDIAWKGIANPESLIRAVELAVELMRKRGGRSVRRGELA